MKKSTATKVRTVARPGKDQIAEYSDAQLLPFRAMCQALRKLIDEALPKATSKVWHGSPVWFIEDNPVVGYSATAKSVNLLFWNGQAFDDPDLQQVGKYGAAQVVFTGEDDIDPKQIQRWLKKASSNVFDSKAFFQKLREEKKRSRD